MIVAKIHGMNGICVTDSVRKEFIFRVTSQLREKGVEDQKDILLSFSGDYVADGEGDASSFCVIYVSPGASAKDIILLVKILKHESALGNRIALANLGPVPKE